MSRAAAAHRPAGATLDSTLLILLGVILTVALGTGIAFLLQTADALPLSARRPRRDQGTPAQAWLAQGEDLSSEMNERAERQPRLARVAIEADHVVTELAETAERTAGLNRVLADVDAEVLAAEHEQLGKRLDGAPAAARDELRASRNAVADQLHQARRRIHARDQLLAAMRATVHDLQLCLEEVDELTEQPGDGPSGSVDALRARLVKLRHGLADVADLPEIRQLTEPGPDSANRANDRRNPLPGDPE